jgi:excinuclease UvrABC nuclease subunit
MKKEVDRIYLHKKEILKLPERAGVYFLYQKDWILVYIGKAFSLKRRVPQHDSNKQFLSLGYEICHWSRVRELEKEHLNRYKREHGQLPYYNKIG